MGLSRQLIWYKRGVNQPSFDIEGQEKALIEEELLDADPNDSDNAIELEDERDLRAMNAPSKDWKDDAGEQEHMSWKWGCMQIHGTKSFTYFEIAVCMVCTNTSLEQYFPQLKAIVGECSYDLFKKTITSNVILM